jgi:hypothetical protein
MLSKPRRSSCKPLTQISTAAAVSVIELALTSIQDPYRIKNTRCFDKNGFAP